MRYFFTIFFLVGVLSAYSQQSNIRVIGEILDKEGVGVINCSVKISSINGIVLNYFNTGDKNTFNANVGVSGIDSIEITISNIAYSNFRIRKSLAGNKGFLKLDITMLPKSNELNAVDIKAPAIWTRGDTTFYQTDAFKDGDEKKLKDIIVKVPNFEIDDKGVLLYKKRPVDKITIDGQELFTDKLDLILNNFPTHVLNTIQAIENQSQNRLLKGIGSEQKIFVNLGLKKNAKLKAAFGDGEVGLGSQWRYNFNPVIFSLYGKLKMGLIANWNSIGNGVTPQQENELKSVPERTVSGMLMQTNQLALINNFDNSRYIKNRQWDNRLQINSSYNKKLASQTEIAYIVDRQNQQTFYNSSIYDGEQYRSRIDSNHNQYTPKIINVRQLYTWVPDSLSELKFELKFYKDMSSGIQESSYQGFGIKSGLRKTTTADWNSYTIKADYTRRLSSNSANLWQLQYNSENTEQQSVGVSGDFAFNFMAPNSDYTSLKNQYGLKYDQLLTSWSHLKRLKTGELLSLGIYYGYAYLPMTNITTLSNEQENVPPIYPLNSPRQYDELSQHRFGISVNKSFKFILKESFTASMDLGWVNSSTRNRQDSVSFGTSVLNINLVQSHKLLKIFSGRLEASFIQSPLQPKNFYQEYFPSTLTSFEKNVNIDKSVKKIAFNYALAWKWAGDLSLGSIYGYASRQVGNNLRTNTYLGLISYSVDSMSNRGTNTMGIALDNQIPSLLLGALINISAGYHNYTTLLVSKENINVIENSFLAFDFSIKKNWNKKYFIKLNSSFIGYGSKLPSAISGSANSKVAYMVYRFNQRFVFNEQLNLTANLNFYQNDFFGVNNENILLCDLEGNYKFGKHPIFLTLKVDNITNEKTYFRFNRGNQSQSFDAIPLIKRNVFMSLRYNF